MLVCGASRPIGKGYGFFIFFSMALKLHNRAVVNWCSVDVPLFGCWWKDLKPNWCLQFFFVCLCWSRCHSSFTRRICGDQLTSPAHIEGDQFFFKFMSPLWTRQNTLPPDYRAAYSSFFPPHPQNETVKTISQHEMSDLFSFIMSVCWPLLYYCAYLKTPFLY